MKSAGPAFAYARSIVGLKLLEQTLSTVVGTAWSVRAPEPSLPMLVLLCCLAWL